MDMPSDEKMVTNGTSADVTSGAIVTKKPEDGPPFPSNTLGKYVPIGEIVQHGFMSGLKVQMRLADGKRILEFAASIDRFGDYVVVNTDDYSMLTLQSDLACVAIDSSQFLLSYEGDDVLNAEEDKAKKQEYRWCTVL